MPRFKASIYIETDTQDQAEHTLRELVRAPDYYDGIIGEDYNAVITMTPYALEIEEPKQYKITSNYGTFIIRKTVTADSLDEAWAETGIMTDLQAAGWECASSPEGETHFVDEIRTKEHELT